MFLDIPPSLVDVLGLPPHPSFQGISLFAPNPDPQRPMFTMVQTPIADQVAIVRGQYKLILSETDQRTYLYDLRGKGEYLNIRNDRPELAAELLAILRRWRDEQLAYYADTTRHSREYPPLPD
jgi:arylsulfatase A-like enzyme